MTDRRLLTGRIIHAGAPLGANPEPIDHQVVDDAPAPPPEVIEVHVHIAQGADLSPIEAEARPWWMPAYPLRTAIVGAAGLMPLPSIGAPAARWALQLGEIQAEQSMGASWTIAAAFVSGAFAFDRSRRRWDADDHAYRPGWFARGLLCAAISGACLALPVFDGLVYVLTGVNP